MILFNLSLSTGYLPNDWKNANVTLTHKGGAKDVISNYRPISLLSTTSKLLERCIHNYIYTITYGDISFNQHGFMKSKSTNTQLVDFYNNVYKLEDNGKQVDVAYLDSKKALDSVPH